MKLPAVGLACSKMCFPTPLTHPEHLFLPPLQTPPEASVDAAEEAMKEVREEEVEEGDEGKVSGFCHDSQ